MAITRMGKISAVLVAAMLISACGANIHGDIGGGQGGIYLSFPQCP